ncbi:MAG TPA: HupE/UreJ family protein [Myxococcaceae bacterium]|nr:HupE/UreJ family protein [Myxococcaceae bacterium]
MRLIAFALSLLFARQALSHEEDLIYARLERGEGGRVHEQLTLTPNTLRMLAPVDADGDGAVDARELEAGREALTAGVWDQIPLATPDGPCTRVGASARLGERLVELAADLECGRGQLTQTFRILSVLPPGYRVVLDAFGAGAIRNQSFAEGNQQTLIVRSEPSAEPALGFAGWVRLGVEHIFGGIDHLAFLVAVLLVGGSWRRALLLVTSFTAAHSLTLAAAALHWVTLTPEATRWVELAIAASIVWVALENLILRRHRHRALLTFGFGLVHGLGFAAALSAHGLGERVITSLLSFNLGVELGQAAIVLALHPIVRLLSRREAVRRWVVGIASTGVAVAGAFWMAERALG